MKPPPKYAKAGIERAKELASWVEFAEIGKAQAADDDE